MLNHETCLFGVQDESEKRISWRFSDLEVIEPSNGSSGANPFTDRLGISKHYFWRSGENLSYRRKTPMGKEGEFDALF